MSLLARFRRECSRKTPIPKAMDILDIPYDGFHFCVFQRWRTGEIAFNVLSLLYGMFFPSFDIHTAATNRSFVKDSSAFLIIIYSTKRGGRIRPRGIPTLLDNIVQGATTYFLVIFTGHLLLVFFELLAPVSDHPADLCSFTHKQLHIGTDSTSSCEVSRCLECHSKGEFDGVASYM